AVAGGETKGQVSYITLNVDTVDMVFNEPSMDDCWGRFHHNRRSGTIDRSARGSSELGGLPELRSASGESAAGGRPWCCCWSRCRCNSVEKLVCLFASDLLDLGPTQRNPPASLGRF